MSLVIHSVVVHRLIKEQHKAIQPSQLRKTLLEPDNADVIKLVAGVLDVYGKRHSAAQYGVFSMGRLAVSFLMRSTVIVRSLPQAMNSSWR